MFGTELREVAAINLNDLPEKFFNIAGPENADDHYLIDPLRRIDYGEIQALIDRKYYFVLHAPRQSGKTTWLLSMTERLNSEGRYRCAYMNVETAQTAKHDVETGMRVILSSFASAAERFLGTTRPRELASPLIAESSGHGAFKRMLEVFCGELDRPLVLFIDEIDSLIGDTLISLLRQLREGYANRPQSAPISVILCGVRDVRDYRIHTSQGEIVTGGSCFNVKAESLRIGDFSQEEVRELYEQHTAATGQVFEEEIYPKVWSLTHGQPWLVNALANQATWKIKENRDRSRPITLKAIETAADFLILERATHLDQLTDKLREPRVRNVLAPMITGEGWTEGEPDDVQYVIDLGLIRGENGTHVVSNGIYREVLPRELTHTMQANLAALPQPWYVSADGKLDVQGLLSAFQQFFREHSESWLERFDYKEAGFQLLLQAFLQRVVNGGGLIDREYALGRGRVDLLIRWRQQGKERQEQRIVLELKTIRAKTSLERVIFNGLEQTAGYADLSNASEAHLIVCDERPGRSWDEKIYSRALRQGDREIFLWGL